MLDTRMAIPFPVAVPVARRRRRTEAPAANAATAPGGFGTTDERPGDSPPTPASARTQGRRGGEVMEHYGQYSWAKHSSSLRGTQEKDP